MIVFLLGNSKNKNVVDVGIYPLKSLQCFLNCLTKDGSRVDHTHRQTTELEKSVTGGDESGQGPGIWVENYMPVTLRDVEFSQKLSIPGFLKDVRGFRKRVEGWLYRTVQTS